MLVDEARVAELGRIKLVRVRMELDPRRDQALPPLGHELRRAAPAAALVPGSHVQVRLRQRLQTKDREKSST